MRKLENGTRFFANAFSESVCLVQIHKARLKISPAFTKSDRGIAEQKLSNDVHRALSGNVCLYGIFGGIMPCVFPKITGLLFYGGF